MIRHYWRRSWRFSSVRQQSACPCQINMPPLDSSPQYEHGIPESLGVLLVNLGTPDDPTPAAVRRYLRQLLSDRRVVESPRLRCCTATYFALVPPRRPKHIRKSGQSRGRRCCCIRWALRMRYRRNYQRGFSEPSRSNSRCPAAARRSIPHYKICSTGTQGVLSSCHFIRNIRARRRVLYSTPLPPCYQADAGYRNSTSSIIITMPAVTFPRWQRAFAISGTCGVVETAC